MDDTLPNHADARQWATRAHLHWYRAEADLHSHPKTSKLARRLHALWPTTPRGLFPAVAAGYVTAAWAFFMSYYADGSAPDNEDTVAALEDFGRWPGERGALVAAMVDAGFLDREHRRLSVHNWHEYQGSAITKRENDAKRQRNIRAKRREIQEMSRATVARPSLGTEQHSTGQDIPFASQTGASNDAPREYEQPRTPEERKDRVKARLASAGITRVGGWVSLTLGREITPDTQLSAEDYAKCDRGLKELEKRKAAENAKKAA